LIAARSLDAAAAAAAGAAGVLPAADGLAGGATAVAGALGAVLAVAAVPAAGRSLATGLLIALDTPSDTPPETALDTAVGTVTCPVFAALPWLVQPVASVTRSVTPTTAATAELAEPGVRRLTPVPW
jgi:hypothetical protein